MKTLQPSVLVYRTFAEQDSKSNKTHKKQSARSRMWDNLLDEQSHILTSKWHEKGEEGSDWQRLKLT